MNGIFPVHLGCTLSSNTHRATLARLIHVASIPLPKCVAFTGASSPIVNPPTRNNVH